VRLVCLLVSVAALLAVALPDAADAARRCRGTSVVTQLRAERVNCAKARRIASEAAAVRRSTERFAAARRCSGDFCIVVSGWRCRPARTPKPRERCTRSRAAIFWLWR
jgi:hypothetical protein